MQMGVGVPRLPPLSSREPNPQVQTRNVPSAGAWSGGELAAARTVIMLVHARVGRQTSNHIAPAAMRPAMTLRIEHVITARLI